jgi:hypothetical protein
MHSHQWSQGELILGAIAGAIIWAFLFAILRAFERKKPEQIEPDILAESLRVVSTPVELPGGRWGKYETRLVECEPPMAPNSLDVHDTTDPRHDARTCKHCRTLKGYSGVSFRSN